jgi:membrane protease YdiL (CAAX protease family)
MGNLNKTRTLIFLILLSVLTGILFPLSSATDSQNISSAIIMWSPAIAALLAGVFTRRAFRSIGWSISPKWLATGWVIPVLYGLITYGLVWASGLGGAPSPTFLSRARLTLGMAASPDWIIIVSAFFYITVVNLIPSMVLSLGEEIGWRGFLVPELSGWLGFRKASWLSGIIWGAWHLPGILSGKYASSGTPILFQLLCFMVLVIGTGVVLAWLRMKSGSIWPAVIFHAVHNGVIQAFLDRITVDTGYTKYVIGEFGIALIPAAVLMAWYCHRRSGELAAAQNQSS